MNAQIKQIAERLRGLRDALNLTIAEAAAKCDFPEADYARFESGTSEHPNEFYMFYVVAQTFG
jgi:transcriptional regulator with XRE-family HTH domain